jgi:hypothetical protein
MFGAGPPAFRSALQPVLQQGLPPRLDRFGDIIGMHINVGVGGGPKASMVEAFCRAFMPWADGLARRKLFAKSCRASLIGFLGQARSSRNRRNISFTSDSRSSISLGPWYSLSTCS